MSRGDGIPAEALLDLRRLLDEQFHARPAEIRRFLNGQLDLGRTRELADRMRAVGLAL